MPEALDAQMTKGPRFKWKDGWRGDISHCSDCGPESSCLDKKVEDAGEGQEAD